MTRSLVDELDRLHAGYVGAVNAAVADDDLARADQLAEEFDVAAIRLMGEHEGRPDVVQQLLDARRATTPAPTRLRRLVQRFRVAA